MAYDRHLADKITRIIKRSKVKFYEKEMMGGITWMLNEKMCISIYKGGLMVRIEPDELSSFLCRQGAEQMTQGGKLMNGYLTIRPEGFDADEDLEYWVQKCLDYNPKAKANKKKKVYTTHNQNNNQYYCFINRDRSQIRRKRIVVKDRDVEGNTETIKLVKEWVKTGLI